MISLGIDTSNYTTSAAVYDTSSGTLVQSRRLLKVKPGELGLRQADAVFQHTLALPEIIKEVSENAAAKPDVIGVSVSPSEEEDSYMPCFMTGKSAADCMGSVFGVPVKYFSHQAGHIAAAVYSAGRLDLLKTEFIAFHVSGGTTQGLFVRPDEKKIITVEKVVESLDLKAGQAIDRVGVMLGLQFPAGQKLDELSRSSSRKYKVRPFMRDGSCSLSGVQNQCEAMLKNGEASADIANYCITYICEALSLMTDELLKKNPGVPVVYSGGVMSNSMIRECFSRRFGAVFAAPGYSSDNACGTAVLAALK